MTKNDFALAIALLKIDLIKWLLGVMFGQMAVIVGAMAILKFTH